MTQADVKKRLMYLSGEDFYLFSYTVLVALDFLNCKKGKFFKDYRKLAFLIEFIRDEKLNYIISNSDERTLNPLDKEYLFSSYSTGLSRRSEILKLLFTLEKKKLVILERGNNNMINVSLNKEILPASFLDKKIFKKEYSNLDSFCSTIQRVTALTLETMLDRIYKQNGIATWAI